MGKKRGYIHGYLGYGRNRRKVRVYSTPTGLYVKGRRVWRRWDKSGKGNSFSYKSQKW